MAGMAFRGSIFVNVNQNSLAFGFTLKQLPDVGPGFHGANYAYHRSDDNNSASDKLLRNAANPAANGDIAYNHFSQYADPVMNKSRCYFCFWETD
jgi:hypothetical protein